MIFFNNNVEVFWLRRNFIQFSGFLFGSGGPDSFPTDIKKYIIQAAVGRAYGAYCVNRDDGVLGMHLTDCAIENIVIVGLTEPQQSYLKKKSTIMIWIF